MKNFLQEYFNFSKSERSATLVLLVLLLLTILLLIKVKNTSPNHQIDEAFLKQELHLIDSINGLKKEPKSQSKSSYLKSNWEKPNWEKKNIKKKNYSAYNSNNNREDQEKKEPKENKHTEIVKINLNTSDSTAMANANFKPWVIKKIIKYRSLLGGYHSKNQLLEVYGMKQKSFNWIEKRVFISPNLTLRKIDLKSATFKEILKHPYLNYEQVKGIVNLRDKNELSDSTLLNLLGTDIYSKLVPYLIF